MKITFPEGVKVVAQAPQTLAPVPIGKSAYIYVAFEAPSGQQTLQLQVTFKLFGSEVKQVLLLKLPSGTELRARPSTSLEQVLSLDDQLSHLLAISMINAHRSGSATYNFEFL